MQHVILHVVHDLASPRQYHSQPVTPGRQPHHWHCMPVFAAHLYSLLATHLGHAGPLSISALLSFVLRPHNFGKLPAVWRIALQLLPVRSACCSPFHAITLHLQHPEPPSLFL